MVGLKFHREYVSIEKILKSKMSGGVNNDVVLNRRKKSRRLMVIILTRRGHR